jgi:hypothetical protein
MRFKITPTTSRLLEELEQLSVEIEPRLDLVSAAARGEWREMRSRFPSAEDLATGFTPVSDEELEVMHAKVQRFREILGVRRQQARAATPNMRLVPLHR